MNAKIVAIAIGVAGVLLAAGVLMAVWPPQQPDAREESKFILPEQETVRIGTDEVIGGQLSDDNGRALASEAVSITSTLPDGSSGGTSTVYTNDRGEFSFAVAPTKAGEHKVTVTYGGNAECKPSTFIIIVVVVIDDPNPDALETALTMSGPDAVKVNTAGSSTGQLKAEDGTGVAGASILIQATEPDGSKRSLSSATTAADGKFSTSVTPTKEGEHTVTASYGGNADYDKSSAAFSFKAEGGSTPTPTPTPEPAPVQGEPKLNVAYQSGTWGNDVYYGMPSQRSGPYPGWDYQYPADNEFRIETNGYGPDQPDGPTKIALFIQVDGIGSRWVGSNEIPEGTVEVRTFPENAYTPRLVNLFNDGAGNCKGILVKDWSVFDHSFVYEQGVTDRDLLTFSLDITKIGSYTVKVWAVHDHGDGTAVQVSNMVSWKVSVRGDRICNTEFSPYSVYDYVNGTDYAFTATVSRNTEPDDDNANLRNTIAYTGTVNNFLTTDAAVTIKINGVVQTGTVLSDGRVKYELGTFDFGEVNSKTFAFTARASDGEDHTVTMYTMDGSVQVSHVYVNLRAPYYW